MNNLFQKLMDEHIEFPGFPQLIATRGFAYSWLSGCGWDKSERGYASLDYAVFSKKAVDIPLVDAEWRDRMLAQVREGYLRC